MLGFVGLDLGGRILAHGRLREVGAIGSVEEGATQVLQRPLPSRLCSKLKEQVFPIH
jgi:hypothetical protein